MARGLGGLAAFFILSFACACFVLEARAQSTLTDAQRIKQLQRQILLREHAERRAELRERREAWKEWKSGRGYRLRAPENAMGDLVPYAPPTSPVSPSGPVPPNVQMNDATGESPGTTQSEVSIAAAGNHVVALWNDAAGIFNGGDVLGYGYSNDGGATWTDGGVPANTGIGIWASDPVVVVNEKTGAFYACGLADQPGNATNAIAMVRGSFSGNSFSWSAPHIVAQVPNSLALLDKEWMAVDSLSGNLYVSYTYFFGATDEIRFQRSTDDGHTWSSPITLSSNVDAGLVQGSRPAVGPNGEVSVVWHAIGPSNNDIGIGPDFLRVRRSADFGTSFASQTTAASLFSNFGSGAPGFNRGVGITFPGIAVDRSSGPHRGRVYLSWPEAVSFPNDSYPRPGVDPAVSEIENNNAGALATPFTPGSIVRGTIALTNDLDYFAWSAVQGETYVFWLDSLALNLDASLRVFCTDAGQGTGTNIAFSQNGHGGEDIVVFTAPTTATYYVRVASYSQASTGRYRIRTVRHDASLPARARDQRDAFVAFSDDGLSWSTPVRANDSPGYFDDWLPEVAVDRQGTVLLALYDWRDTIAQCGGGSNAYLDRSGDGGLTWSAGQRMSDQSTVWSQVYDVLIPNQGDYIGLFAGSSTHLAWADGRNGDADVFTALPSHLQADAGADQSVDCNLVNGLGTPVRLDGSASEGATTYLWTSPGIFFDDPTSPTPTGYFPSGSTQVTLEVGNGSETSTDVVEVTVADHAPPSIQIALSPSILWPPNHVLADIHAVVEVTDDCDPAPSIQLVSIVSSEPDTGPDPDDLPADIQEAQLGAADFAFLLRSERLGTGDGRTYTVCYRAEDHAGNSRDACVVVTVPHDQRGRARLEKNAQGIRLVLLGSEGMGASTIPPGSVEVRTAHFQSFLPQTDGALAADLDGDGYTDLSLPFAAADSWSVPSDEPLAARWLAGGTGVQADVERGDITGVEDGPGASFAIVAQPNPAKARTVLRYSLPRAGEVRLSIFDVSGHLVTRLVSGPMAAGAHEAAFPSSRLKSAQLYLYRLEWEDQVLGGKLVIFP